MLGQVFAVCLAACLFVAAPASAAGRLPGPLVTAAWLKENLARADLVVIDASPTQAHKVRHIPGAASADLFAYGPREPTVAEMERRLQSWGVSPDKAIVVYDQGGSFLATRIFFDLVYNGVPAHDVAVLDGGLAKWIETGGSVTAETTAPKNGTYRVARTVEEVRVRLPEFLVASGNPKDHALVEALEPAYHFGSSKFFDRGGHVPNALMWPTEDFFNADKTFKSPDELRRMAAYLGVRPEQQIHTYCGGGVAATVPFFALKYLLDYPKVRLYKESQLEWLRDDRGLPFWTYADPTLKREAGWLNGWGSSMARMFGIAHVSVVDVRSTEAYRQGHVPFALSLPADLFRTHLANPGKLAAALGAAGVHPEHEAVIVSEGGLTPSAALAFALLEKVGQKKVSILMESADDWGLAGYPLTKEPTTVGARKSPKDMAVPAADYTAKSRTGVLVGASAVGKGLYPTVVIASGKSPPAGAETHKVVHLPYTELLNGDGTPKPAKDLWNLLVKAGVPRYAEIVCVADDPAEAAVNYYLLKLMGFPDVKVRLG
jgi:3-mercaptopyruvate sulfurtransferase SseA